MHTGTGDAQTPTNSTSTGGQGVSASVLYRIGGGTAVPLGTAPNMSSLAVGIGWNTNLLCGQMSLTKTLQDQLNGITTGFQQIMSTVIQNATAAVASLPALIIQRREGAAAIEMEPDAESSRRGWMRLMGIVGLDVAGIALGVLLIILIALLVRELGRLGGH